MTEMYDRTILQALQAGVTAAVAASVMPTLPVKFVDIQFEPPDDQKWLELVFIPNNLSDYWGDERDYRGMFRMILHWPNNSAGAYPPMDILASICGYFSKDTLLQNVRVSDRPNLTGVLTEGAESLYPASLRYQCFRP